MLEVPADQIPAAALNALEVKHQTELEDLLKNLYDKKAKELLETIQTFLEAKVRGQADIGLEYQSKK